MQAGYCENNKLVVNTVLNQNMKIIFTKTFRTQETQNVRKFNTIYIGNGQIHVLDSEILYFLLK